MISRPTEKFLKDYQPPGFAIDSVSLTFVLKPEKTQVYNCMKITPLTNATELVLDGEHLRLISVSIDGVDLTDKQYQLTQTSLILKSPLSSFELEVITEVDPEKNTRLEGLYRTNGIYCTQCEAEGFRSITYYLDRPDVLSYFTTKVIASKSDVPVLLSNGNLIESGELDSEKHYAIWHDPFKKPSYLFALVAGDLKKLEDTFLTHEGRQVNLEIYVEPHNIDKCSHAMTSLKKAMVWDEKRFGLSYDLDRYMIVAVDDFNMGAMENKGLNVFNSKFVLADSASATDHDYEGIESVIGHEYFHNWTGNRITCRDWFQLTLKEGLTVFRDQEFSADMLSASVKRIEDVRQLRSYQFPEDAGPMAHPIQPQSYIEMNNFYTLTVYEKGAEVVRLYHTLLGESGFQKGMQLYVERYDGQAVTIENFRSAMADANHQDLSQMHNWYIQAGTPRLTVREEFDASSQSYQLHFSQYLKDQQSHLPFLIPVLINFMDKSGKSLTIQLKNASNQSYITEKGFLLKITEMNQSFEFVGLTEMPIVSLLRNFSAPVQLDFFRDSDALMTLASFDDDPFVRWESIQVLAMNNFKACVECYETNQPMQLSDPYQVAFSQVLQDETLDKALKALAVSLPELSYLAEQYRTKNIDALLAAHNFLKKALAETFEKELKHLYLKLQAEEEESYHYTEVSIARRKLKNICLKYLLQLTHNQSLAVEQYQSGHNMTDILAALESMNQVDSSARDGCLSDFYQNWQGEQRVLDKWFALQASAPLDNIIEIIKGLTKHLHFSYQTPNRVRSVLGVFGRQNWEGFHRASGEGYQFFAQQVLHVDVINPQVAARLVGAFSGWRSISEPRRTKMKKALMYILAQETLSKDVYEIVTKTLGDQSEANDG
ncbi:MAG: aminopeptidase N [Piscirickettsiaceae bacterium CG_4_9_14_3_um_filter_43_564]|nr:aminopeptidase N [Thiomicrospira sp.]OIP96054.1 MAG: aminopeptidase N [Thiomicrospira sp. CG2_30_44_34]PIQ03104.1 MAG: aminopeptidase N [Piscirickettsiaceae bacterium CG18_big_fil_WC_8_21_14_2_50_44_103]PIW57163.1 MAG: aminopeptidase N [Piscirickettsiaceae bacterium CG12_big_fil_rev_8_21_14_0_65_44_934]PIW77319.1 MAG: aminopeptidase N [Piscirickettsiaceae bacterium CG_4_8_14_3_um_filter_44_38]PIX79675.1 MAG: aminopeptidase N [Piscirickettsiaceae bacterium CG_4_10_14_3_um_filter_44_349]PIY7